LPFEEQWINVGRECCFPGVLRDGGDAPANLLCQLNGHVVLCASCLHRKLLVNLAYLSILCSAVLLAAPPGLAAVLPMWDSAYVPGTVTSHAMSFPLAHGKRVVPSGRLLSSRIRLTGSLTAGIWARLIGVHMMSFR